MEYDQAAANRAMKRNEIIAKPMSGALKSRQAAEIRGLHPRHVRRVRERWLAQGNTRQLDAHRRSQ